MSSEVFVWGLDSRGQLGLDSKQALAYSLPVTCSYNIPIFHVACGDEHSLLLTPDGLLYAFGSNADGRLGIGDRGSLFRAVPTLVGELEGVPIVTIACGAAHSAAVSTSGDLFTWGQGRNGALGTGGSLSHWSPQQVSFPSGCAVVSVSCGGRHTCALLKEPNSPAKSVYVFGAGEAGQLGLGRKEMELTPKRLTLEDEVETIAAGTLHTLLLSLEGKVLATGNNASGQLGTGTRKSEKRPVLVSALSSLAIRHIAAYAHSAAISRDNCLYIWGSGVFGEYLTPQRVKSAVEAESVSLGNNFAAAVDTRGQVWTWGNNAHGELGHGDNSIRLAPYPVMALRNKKVKSVACGSGFVIALGEDTTPNRPEKGRRSVKVEELPRSFRSKSNEPLSDPPTPSFFKECRSHIDATKVYELELHKEQQLRLSLQKRIDFLVAENETLRHSASQAQTSLLREQRESAWRTQSSLQLSSNIDKLTRRAKDADYLELQITEMQQSLKSANAARDHAQEMMEASTRATVDATRRAEMAERELQFARAEISRLESELVASMKGQADAQRLLERNTLKAEAAVQELTRRQEDLEMSWTLKTHSEISKADAIEKEVEYLRAALRKAVENATEATTEFEKLKAKNLALQRELSDRTARIEELEALLMRHEAKNKSLLEALESEVKSRASVLSRAKAAVSVGAESRTSFSSSFLERTMRQGEADDDKETFRGKHALEARMDLLEQKISTLKRNAGFSSDLSL